MNHAVKVLPLMFTLVLLASLIAMQSAMVKAESTTINPEVKYTLYKPLSNITYSQTMPLDFSFDVTYDDPSVTSLGLSLYYRVDDGSIHSMAIGNVRDRDVFVGGLSNGTHELSAYVDAPYVYNGSIFGNTLKLFSTNFKVLNLPVTPSPTAQPTPAVSEMPVSLVIVLSATVMAAAVFLKKRGACGSLHNQNAT